MVFAFDIQSKHITNLCEFIEIQSAALAAVARYLWWLWIGKIAGWPNFPDHIYYDVIIEKHLLRALVAPHTYG